MKVKKLGKSGTLWKSLLSLFTMKTIPELFHIVSYIADRG